ncbi:HmuY family protein [Flavobacterium sp. WC2509]|uniref:HmuY family protein n=1 Tax=Flavobacterium sp. WC2509 TaxID=3461406 RepID=UPI004043DBAA
MKNNFILILSFVLLAFTACNNDDAAVVETSTVALAGASLNLTAKSTPIEVKFDKPAAEAGSITLTFTEAGVVYGTDFATTPAATGKTLVIPFAKDATSVTFAFHKLKEAVEGEVKNVVFTISSVTVNTAIAANKSIQLNFNETASLGGALAALVGGANEPNQVFVDLSSGTMTSVVRTSWDLGFYGGSDFRVVLNATVKMAAKQLTTTNIDEIQTSDDTMIIGGGAGSVSQIDDVTGDISKTAIATISATDADNKVYLIYMGNNPLTTAPALGSEGSSSGTSRGWMKIRVLRSGTGYKVQYAAIDATTHSEVTISKDAAYNFTFFSLLDKKIVTVEPQKAKWDISFTTFTNLAGPTTPYFYADFVLNNLKGEAKTYQVLTTEFAYDNFTLANVAEAKFTADQRNIGSNWRGTTNGVDANGNPKAGFTLKTDRFFVVKDPAGNVYKLKFTGGASETGERGFPKFQYAILK